MSDEKKPNLPSTTEDISSRDLNVVPEDTAGNALDVVTNFISRLDPSSWIARNAAKAFGKLCSAPKEWYDAYFEGKTAETRARTDARVKIISEGANQITQQMNVQVEYAQIALNKEMEKLIGERLNLDSTCAVAANDLLTTESTSSTNQGTYQPNEPQSADSTNQDANSSREKVVDDVWLNIFETEARPQSTEGGQLLFGRILAGEIRNPGSYSFRTLKTLGELDEKVAALFKELCSACVVMEFPLTKPRHIAGVKGLDLYRNPKKNIFDMRVPALGGDPGQGDLSKYGFGFSELNVLNEYGLITSTYNSSFEYNLFLNKENSLPIIPFRHQGKDWILLPLPSRDKNQGFKWSGVELSQVGRELYSVVDQHPMDEYTEDLKKYFDGQKLRMVEASNR